MRSVSVDHLRRSAVAARRPNDGCRHVVVSADMSWLSVTGRLHCLLGLSSVYKCTFIT